MSYLISGQNEPSFNAASYIIKKYNIAKGATFITEFESEFNCILDFAGHIPDEWTVPTWIQFETEEEMTMFLLRFA